MDDERSADAGSGEGQTPEQRKQWHPVLIDGLRYFFGGRLRVEPEVALSALPTRVDAMLIQQEEQGGWPYPYTELGPTTLVELVSPGDWATWRHSRKLLGDWVFWSLREDREDMGDVASWLISSRVSDAFIDWLGEEFGQAQVVGPGVTRFNCHGSPFVVVNLHTLPLTVESLPLMMAYKGPRETEVAEMALKHGRQYPMFLEQAAVYHGSAMREALMIHGFGPEVYRPLIDMDALIELIGTQTMIEGIGEGRFIKEIGERRIINEIGEERIINEIGEERLLKDLITRLGPERAREILEGATHSEKTDTA